MTTTDESSDERSNAENRSLLQTHGPIDNLVGGIGVDTYCDPCYSGYECGFGSGGIYMHCTGELKSYQCLFMYLFCRCIKDSRNCAETKPSAWKEMSKRPRNDLLRQRLCTA
jgi:hypothetical protein